MFNVSKLHRKSIKLFHQKLWLELIGPCMAYNIISIKRYIKSHLELQREITLIELAPSPYFFVSSICLAYINMFARFDENPAKALQDIKETKPYGLTDGRENSIPTTNKVPIITGTTTTSLLLTAMNPFFNWKHNLVCWLTINIKCRYFNRK